MSPSTTPIIVCMGVLMALAVFPIAAVQGQTLEEMQHCRINAQLAFGYEEQFAEAYCEDLYMGTGKVLTPQQRVMHINFWQQYYAASVLPFIQHCMMNMQLAFGYEEQFAEAYCEDLYMGTGKVLTPQQRVMHINFWQQYYAASVQQPISPEHVPQLDIEKLHDDWLCTVPFDSFPGSGLDQPQPSFREAC